VYDFDGVLNHSTVEFVDRYVRSLLTWDILVFFHRNPDSVLDIEGLVSRLGRRAEELQPEVDELCRDRILQNAGGLIRYHPTPELRTAIGEFAEACQERGRRLAFIALVLHKINPHVA
jgi:hypothetical protein